MKEMWKFLSLRCLRFPLLHKCLFKKSLASARENCKTIKYELCLTTLSIKYPRFVALSSKVIYTLALYMYCMWKHIWKHMWNSGDSVEFMFRGFVERIFKPWNIMLLFHKIYLCGSHFSFCYVKVFF